MICWWCAKYITPLDIKSYLSDNWPETEFIPSQSLPQRGRREILYSPSRFARSHLQCHQKLYLVHKFHQVWLAPLGLGLGLGMWYTLYRKQDEQSFEILQHLQELKRGKKKNVFSCLHATVWPGLSISQMVGRLVHKSNLAFFGHFMSS